MATVSGLIKSSMVIGLAVGVAVGVGEVFMTTFGAGVGVGFETITRGRSVVGTGFISWENAAVAELIKTMNPIKMFDFIILLSGDLIIFE